MTSTELLRRLVSYDPDTGIFRWKVRRPGIQMGAIVGSKHSAGYRETTIDRRRYYLHRLAWQYIYGFIPEGQIDHINGDKSDNRIANLREANQTQNSANMKLRPNNTSGFKSVYFHKVNEKWIAQICVDYKVRYIGSYTSPEEAHSSYLEKAKEIFGEFARSA